MDHSQRYEHKKYMKIQDEQILELVKDQSTLNNGFKLLMDTYQIRLYHHIRAILNNHDDTDDVLQNTFIKVFKYLPKFEGRSNLYTWMFRIATNEAMTFLNKNKRKNEFLDEVLLDGATGKSFYQTEFDGEKIKAVLNNAIAKLPVKQKKVFSLRYFEEMSYKEMSEVLETSVGALKASYHHAVKKIESYVETIHIY